MEFEKIALAVSLALNFVTLVLFIVQTRFLAAQTESLKKSIAYSSYQKLNDYINDVNLLLLDHKSAVEIFANLDSVKERIKNNKDLSVEKIALAWHLLNRYETAFTGHELGVIPDDEWEVWKKRMAKDIKNPFVLEVWKQDLTSWDYNKKFKQLIDSFM